MLRHIGKVNLISAIVNAIIFSVVFWNVFNGNTNTNYLTAYFVMLINICLFDVLSFFLLMTGKKAFSIICGIGIILTNITIYCFLIMCYFGFKMDGWDKNILSIIMISTLLQQFGFVRGIFTIRYRKNTLGKERIYV